jgi:phosphoadenosine phosphosulfate reductase
MLGDLSPPCAGKTMLAQCRSTAVEAIAPVSLCDSLVDRLRGIRAALAGRIVFTTSFGREDQVLADAIFSEGLAIDVVTLDTGRLFAQTYAVWRQTEQRYQRRIGAYYPHHQALEALVARQGIDGFYQSLDQRKACCAVRKVEPLGRALVGAQAWLTGLRAGQSAARAGLAFCDHSDPSAPIKINPLFDWQREDIDRAIAARAIPVNSLHAEGFASIGCAPCTRAIRPGEDERAGRWWWESEDKKECGLHVTPLGQRQAAGDGLSP